MDKKPKTIMHVTEAFGSGVLSAIAQFSNQFESCPATRIIVLHAMRPETPANFKKLFRKPEIQFQAIPLKRNISLISDLIGLILLCYWFLKFKPDVIHLHSSKAGFLGRLAGFLLFFKPLNIIYSPHAFAFLNPHLSPFKQKLYRWLEYIGGRLNGNIIACSDSEFKLAQGFSKKVILLKNSVPALHLQEIRNRYTKEIQARRSANKINICLTGRISIQKNPAEANKIYNYFNQKKLKIADFQVQFLWVGDGEETINFPKTGWLSQESALATLAKECDILLHPAKYEGLSLTLLEAQAMGIPVVCSNIAANREIITEETGFLADATSDYISGLESYLSNPALIKAHEQQAKSRIVALFDEKMLHSKLNFIYFGQIP